VHLVGSYYTDISRCTVNKTLNMYLINITIYCYVTPCTSSNKISVSKKHVFSNLSGEMKAYLPFEVNVHIYIKTIPPSTPEDSNSA